jgi:protein involved in polysaccharide export with SLBB domain
MIATLVLLALLQAPPPAEPPAAPTLVPAAPAAVPATQAAAPTLVPAATGDYEVGPGDVIEVAVYGNDDL